MLAKKYSNINKLLIVKMSNKRKLCVDENRLPSYDEELYCKYRRKVDKKVCEYYTGFIQQSKVCRHATHCPSL